MEETVSVTARIRTVVGILAAGLLLTALTLLPGGAVAQDAAKPTPCGDEPLLKDPADDAAVDPTAPLGLTSDKGLPNQDIKSFFFDYKDGVLTANIQVANLTKDVPAFQDSQAGEWNYVIYTDPDGKTRRFVRAVNDGDTITYVSGTISTEGPLTGVYTTGGATKGNYFEGPDGIIQIVVPADAGGKAGAKLSNVQVTMDDIQGLNDAVGFNNHVDTAPDEADVTELTGGADYEVAPCEASVTPVAPITTATPTELPLKVTKALDGAKKAAKKKSLRLSVSATDTITDLSVALKPKNGKGATFASGKASTVSGSATLKLKVLKPKKFKSGTYALVAKGTLNGTKLKATLLVKVKK
jgi:hypothetical protein